VGAVSGVLCTGCSLQLGKMRAGHRGNPGPSRVRVYNADLLSGLLDEAHDGMVGGENGQNQGRRTGGSRARRGEESVASEVSSRRRQKMAEQQREEELEEQRRRRFEQHKAMSRHEHAESQRRVQEAVLTQRMKKEDEFRYHTSQIMEGKRLVDRIGESLSLQDAAARNKTRRQFEEWNKEVYGKIQGRISEKLDAMDYRKLNQRRNEEFQKFLDTTNSKGAIFRDIIIESEYDPLEPNRRAIKVSAADVQDPCRRVVDKNLEEAGMLASPQALKAMRKPKVRETLEVEDWASGKIEATPHGFFAKIMSQKTTPSSEPQQLSGTWRSEIPFDHYHVARGKEVTDLEFPRGKRTKPPTIDKSQGQEPKTSGRKRKDGRGPTDSN